MTLRKILVATGLAALTLAACSPGETPHDVAYYRDHADDRAAQMAKCRNDPGNLGKTPNCLNALRADADAASEKAWTLPKTESRVRDPGKL